MPLLDQIQKDMVAAMKAKDEARLSAIRMVKLTLIEGYLPAAPSDEEIAAAIEAAIAETGITDKAKMGQVMNAAKAKLAGKRVDGKALSEKVRARLG